jgi:hypothetical protein
VLKVARHGSKSSSSPEFLASVAPRVAIVTAESGGFGNLPNPEVLEALRNAGARVVRMDTAGATTVQWTAGSLVVRTYGAGEAVVETGTARAAGVPRVALKAAIPTESIGTSSREKLALHHTVQGLP